MQNKGISFSTLLLILILGFGAYYTINYVIELPGKKANEVKVRVSTTLAPAIEKVVSREGKTYKIIEIGKNYIKIKGHVFSKTITPDDLTGPIPEGTTKLIKRGGKYTPLIK